jgi:hypothetical protein
VCRQQWESADGNEGGEDSILLVGVALCVHRCLRYLAIRDCDNLVACARARKGWRMDPGDGCRNGMYDLWFISLTARCIQLPVTHSPCSSCTKTKSEQKTCLNDHNVAGLLVCAVDSSPKTPSLEEMKMIRERIFMSSWRPEHAGQPWIASFLSDPFVLVPQSLARSKPSFLTIWL